MSQNCATNSIFRPWDATKEVPGDREKQENPKCLEVGVIKCEREAEEDEGFEDPPSSSSTGSSRTGASPVQPSNQHAAEDDSLNKLATLVDRTVIGVPTGAYPYDCSCRGVAFPPTSVSGELSNSVFVPPQGYVAAYPPIVPYPNVPSSFNGGPSMGQEVAGGSQPVIFEHLRAVQQNHLAIEEAARLLQHHEALIKQNRKFRPKKFRCPHCDVAFSNNGQLKGHIRIHTGERPFKCDEEGCGKTFTRNEELTRHKRIHSGLRPHACPTCGKCFGRKDHLKKHARTHELRGPTIFLPAPGPFPFPVHPPVLPYFLTCDHVNMKGEKGGPVRRSC